LPEMLPALFPRVSAHWRANTVCRRQYSAHDF
jgi:hypothetical protein